MVIKYTPIVINVPNLGNISQRATYSQIWLEISTAILQSTL